MKHDKTGPTHRANEIDVTYSTLSSSTSQPNSPRFAARLLRSRQAAGYLGISAWKLRQLITDGRLPVVQDADGGPFRLDVRDLDVYIDISKRTIVD